MSEYARPPRAPRGRRDRRGSSTRARCVARAATLRARARARRRSSARAGGRERRARAGRREISRESITHAFIHSLGRKKKTLVHARERRRAARDFCDEDSVRALYVYRCSPSGGTFDRDAQKEYHRERGRARFSHVSSRFGRGLLFECFQASRRFIRRSPMRYFGSSFADSARKSLSVCSLSFARFARFAWIYSPQSSIMLICLLR